MSGRQGPTSGTVSVDITAELVAQWADVVDDHNPLHLDADFAATTTFEVPITHGSLLFSLACDVLLARDPQWASTGGLTVRFAAPVPVGAQVELAPDADGGLAVRCADARPATVTVHRGSRP
jgi:acyl dehydratase